MTAMAQKQSEARRGTDPAEEDYLARIGERLRLTRARRGMSRKVLSLASGVSERYLAEMERGAGNASLLVVRRLAAAMGIRVSELAAEEPDRSIDLHHAIHQLERLTPAEITEARAWLASRFSKPQNSTNGRVALIGLRGAGKTTLGQALAASMGVPFIELDREIERASGMEMSEVFAAHGQSGFRRLEFTCLEQTLATYERCVIATGGSLVTEPRTFDLLLSECFVVWLRASPDQHMARVAAQGDMRPMASSRQAMDDLQAILVARAPLYGRANASVDTSETDETAALEQLEAVIAGQEG
jgi:XRE family transcriptional regulator, aerobic/anaerobic benzoate catabolism transcriptional regulator